jgi:aldose 1-epimerase
MPVDQPTDPSRVQSFGPSAVGPGLLDLGATVHSLEVTGGDGTRRNVVLGHPTAQDYLDSTAYLGATVGRYANRIASGRFRIDGTEHQVATNDRGNALHGGPDGFDKRLWRVASATGDRAELRLESPDGDQGFPGRLHATARFTVGTDEVRLELEAVTDAPTVVNLTSHTYFNLTGGGTVEEHLLSVPADRYTPVDGSGIPLGGYEAVGGTPFDLRKPTRIATAVRTAHPQVAAATGIDHNLAPRGSGLRPVASVESTEARLRLTVSSDQPGLQVYTGNFLDGSSPGASGLLRQGDGLALEAQLPPDTPNRPQFGSAVLRPDQTYRSTIVWSLQAT